MTDLKRCVGVIALLFTSFTSGCSGDLPPTKWEVQRQIVGDTTTVHTIAGQVWSGEVHLSEDLVIGGLDAPAPFIFGNVSRLAEDRHGGIYVLDSQVPEIRHFGRVGEFVGTVGRSGDGPGEYGRLSMGMVVDSSGVLYVHTFASPPRVARFTEDGQALDPWILYSSFLRTVPGTWVYSDAPDRVLVTTSVDGNDALLVMENGSVQDTLLVPQLPGLPLQHGGPYSVETYWSWHPEGYFVVGVSNQYSLDARRSDGVLRIRRDVKELAVHREEAEAWRRRFEWFERQPGYLAPAGEWIPRTMPPFRGIEVGGDGRIWVRRNTHPIQVAVDPSRDGQPPVPWAQPFLYDVFEADGTFLGEIRFPERFEPHLFGPGYVWGVRRGDVDEQYVVRLAIRGAD